MSIRAVVSALDMMPPAVTSKARLVAVALADQVNDETRYAYPSVTTLIRRTGLSRRSVFRALDELEEVGVLTRLPRFTDNRQTTTAYVWNLWITLAHEGPQMRGVGVTLTPGEVSR